MDATIRGLYTRPDAIPELLMASNSFEDPKSPRTMEEAARDANGNV